MKNIIKEEQFEKYLIFLNTIYNDDKSRYLSYTTIDPLYVKDSETCDFIIKSSESNSLEDLWVSASLKVLIQSETTLTKLQNKIGKISLKKIQNREIQETLRIIYRETNVFFSNNYMPLLIRAKNKSEKWKILDSIITQVCLIATTMKFLTKESEVLQQMLQRFQISNFYANYLTTTYNSITNHLEVDKILCGPGSSASLQFMCRANLKNDELCLKFIKMIYEKLKDTYKDIHLYDIENQMCEFQKVYDIKEDRWKPEFKKYLLMLNDNI